MPDFATETVFWAYLIMALLFVVFVVITQMMMHPKFWKQQKPYNSSTKAAAWLSAIMVISMLSLGALFGSQDAKQSKQEAQAKNQIKLRQTRASQVCKGAKVLELKDGRVGFVCPNGQFRFF